MKQKFILFVTTIFLSNVFAVENTTTKTQSLSPEHSVEKPRPKLYDQGHKVEHKEMLPGYNAPARIDIRDAWDVFVRGSFIYWQAREEGLELATSKPETGIFLIPNSDGRIIDMRYKFKPGFKVRFGFNVDYGNWTFYGEYTRFHSSTSVSTIAPNFPTGRLNALWGIGFFGPAIPTGAVEARGDWRLEVDLLDVEASRDFYVGTKLTFTPHFGLRSSWIDQRYDARYIWSIDSGQVQTDNPSKSNTWGIGPRFGIDTNWLLVYGLRFFGSLAFNLPYTRQEASTQEPIISNNQNFALPAVFKEKGHYLKPSTEAVGGFGWGSYFSNYKWHFDLMVAYEFHQFWNQNLMKGLAEQQAFSFSQSALDLYLHGLTVTARLDF